jgi:hypothetical protein
MPKGKPAIIEIERQEGRSFLEMIKELNKPSEYGRYYPESYKMLNINQIEEKYGMPFEEVWDSNGA